MHRNVVRLRVSDHLFVICREQMIGFKVSDDIFTASFVRKKSWIFGRPFSKVGLEVVLMPEKTLDLIHTVGKKLHDWRFRERSKERPPDFTRERKVGFVDVVSIILNGVRRTTQVELDDFLERLRPILADLTTYTKQSFAEARQKLRPEAFVELNDALVDRYYRDEDYQTFRGFRLLAIDGSTQQLPDSPQLRTKYGVAKGKGGFSVAKARSSQLYDVLNGIAVHAILAPLRTGERALARQHIQAFLRLASHSVRTIILFDRGYPSLTLLYYLMYYGIRPVMRVPSGFYPKIIGAAQSNTWVTLTLSSAQARELYAQGIPATAGTAVRLRVIKLTLPSGQIETLVTTLTEEEMPEEAFPELYFKRWRIEVHYGQDKYALEVENFSGTTPRVVEQDYYATMLFSNLATAVQEEAQAEVEATRDQHHRKYDQYRINFRLLVGTLKYRMIRLLWAQTMEAVRRQESLFQRLIARVARYVVPVIPGRKAPRSKQRARKNKFVMTLRRCF